MNVPFFDLTRQTQSIEGELAEAYSRVMKSGVFVGGEEVRTFESAFAQYHGAHDCVSVGNGTDALYVALKCLGIGPGDEVITSAFSYVATKNAIIRTGATPIFVDIDDTWNLDIAKLPTALSAKTKAVVPVHLYGLEIDLKRLSIWAKEHNLLVVEDSAQHHGKRDTIHSDAICYSFYPTKQLGCYGDGGAVLLSERLASEGIQSFVNHDKEDYSINSRLDSLQAAFLSVKLEKLNGWIERRQEIAFRYSESLDQMPEIVIQSESNHSWYNYTIQVEHRDDVAMRLSKLEVGTKVNYPYSLDLEAPKAKQHSQACLSLPLFPEMADDEVRHVIHSLQKAIS